MLHKRQAIVKGEKLDFRDLATTRSKKSGPKAMAAGVGWKRDIVNGRVLYLSSSNYPLWSYNEVAAYLSTEGTCKCGLDCPVLIHKAFNFDPRAPIKPSSSTADGHLAPGPMGATNPFGNLCSHKRKLQALADYHNSIAEVQRHVHHNDVASGVIRQANYVHEHGKLATEVTCVTNSITEVIPCVGQHQILSHHHQHHHHAGHQQPTATTQLVQIVNPSFQFASGAVTIVHQGPHADQYGHQAMDRNGLPLLLGPATAPFAPTDHQMMMSPAGVATGYVPMSTMPCPQYVEQATHYIAQHPGQQQHGLVFGGGGLSKKRANRSQIRKKEYRSNRHPPTVAAILLQAENEKKRLQVEAANEQRIKQEEEEEEEGHLDTAQNNHQSDDGLVDTSNCDNVESAEQATQVSDESEDGHHDETDERRALLTTGSGHHVEFVAMDEDVDADERDETHDDDDVDYGDQDDSRHELDDGS